MTKEELLAKVQAVIDAPSCYAGLREAAQAYLAAVGTAGEKAGAEALLTRLREDVQSIDEVMPFFASDKAVSVGRKSPQSVGRKSPILVD